MMRRAGSSVAVLGLLAATAGYGAAEGGDASDGELPGQVIVGDRDDALPLSATGVVDYPIDAQQIEALPQGARTPLTDILAQLPGVAIDQNQQVHIRDTEGPGFQYRINGFLVPLDINSNPPFISLLNAGFVDRLDLRVGILDARYGLATGGVVDIQSRDGCRGAASALSIEVGQRSTVAPDIEIARCDGALSTYVSARQTWSDTAFSSATPGPTPIHDAGRTAQLFGSWSYALSGDTRLDWLLATTRSDNELPDAPGLVPAYRLAGVAVPPAPTAIDSRLDFRDALLMGDIRSSRAEGLDLQLGASVHVTSQEFLPDPAGELIYQGVASHALHEDHDYTLQGDLHAAAGAHTIGAGFYAGVYDVRNSVDSQVFRTGPTGAQLDDAPLRILTASSAANVVTSLYVDDVWRVADDWTLDAGLRGDSLTGYTRGQALGPRLNVQWRATDRLSLHAGAGRFMQVPSFLGIAPDTQASFAGTTAAGPPGVPVPRVEVDLGFDAGGAVRISDRLSLSVDNYYQRTRDYLDTGQFGVVPIFAPFNYDHGHLWGSEWSLRYAGERLSGHASFTAGRNWQQGVATGQFNFSAAELATIDAHPILLDHQPVRGASAGVSVRTGAWAAGVDGLYSSGLAGGFADSDTLPRVVQINGSVQRSFATAAALPVDLRLSVLNLLDRRNEIRSAQGIGIFEAAYGPRRTLYATVTLRF